MLCVEVRCQCTGTPYIVVDVEVLGQRVSASPRGGAVVGHRVCRHGETQMDMGGITGSTRLSDGVAA